MLTFIYDFALFSLMLVFFPKLLWQCIFHRKYRKSFINRIFPTFPEIDKKKPVIWLHAVSVGETKALSTLTPHIRQTYPDAFILVSTLTETGQIEAMRLIQETDAFCYLPLDFSWVIRRFVRELKPNLLILVEGDFWYNLLKEVKNVGGAIALVNGRISETSMKRYLFLRRLSQKIFQKVDTFCVQSEAYMEQFLKLGVDSNKISVIGNLKYDIRSPNVSSSKMNLWKEQLGLEKRELVITVGSTHEKEEKLILEAFKPLWNQYTDLKLLLVPRHPERFQKVEKVIQEDGISYIKYSTLNQRKGNERVILIDQMGILAQCYQVSILSIVGGSFIDGVGGHDIFEPIKMGAFVLFGPYMSKQQELCAVFLKSGIGKQVRIDGLTTALAHYLSKPMLLKQHRQKSKNFIQKMMGSSLQTWNQIKHYST